MSSCRQWIHRSPDVATLKAKVQVLTSIKSYKSRSDSMYMLPSAQQDLLLRLVPVVSHYTVKQDSPLVRQGLHTMR
jgi:hypothetical protein